MRSLWVAGNRGSWEGEERGKRYPPFSRHSLAGTPGRPRRKDSACPFTLGLGAGESLLAKVWVVHTPRLPAKLSPGPR